MKNLRASLVILALPLLLAAPHPAHGVHGSGKGGNRPPPPPPTFRAPGSGSSYGKANRPLTPSSAYPKPGAPRTPYGPGGYPGLAWPWSLDGSFGLDMTEWSWWWDFNKEIYLQLKARLLAHEASSGSDGFFLGRGQKTQRKDDGIRPTRDQIRSEIVPSLLRTLESEKAQSIQSACLVALARTGEDERAAKAELEPVILRYLKDSNLTVQETAVIALGILGNDSSAILLTEILYDGWPGRRALGQSEVPLRARSFAAYALGLLGHQSKREDVRRFVVHALTRGIDEDDSATADITAACVIALGRVPLEPCGVFPEPGGKSRLMSTASLEAQVSYLIGLLRDERKLRALARAHVPTSLGLLAAAPSLDGTEVKARVAEVLFERLSLSRRETNQVLQSCAIALGLIGDVDGDELDAKIRRTLIGFPGRVDDRQARHFALISAGWVSERPGRSEPVGVPELRSFLLRQFGKGKEDTAHWAGLALGLLGRAEAARGDLPTPEIGQALRHELKKARSPSDVGAFSIAGGLLRDPEAAPLMRERLQRTKDDDARGYAAVGLGLLNDRTAFERIRRLTQESTYRPDLLRRLAIALGLLGDRTAVDLLLENLGSTSALSAQASIARALGLIGDRRAVTPLVEMLANERLSDQVRAYAAAALGIVADEEELPWNTALSVGLNYTAAPTPLFDHQGFGVLNIL